MSVPDPAIVDWVPLGGGGMASSLEIDYAEISSDVTLTVTTEAAAMQVIAGHSVNLIGAMLVDIDFYAPAWNNVNVASGITVLLYDGATLIGQIFKSTESAINGDIYSVNGHYRYLAAPGVHQWNIKAYATATGKIIRAGNGGSASYVPAYLRVSQAVGIPGPLGPQGPQAAGSVIVVANTSELPPVPNDGDLAFIIVDDAPLPLVYDATIGKWISRIFPAVTQYGGTQAGPTWSAGGTTDMNTITTGDGRIIPQPFRLYDAVGLSPQARLAGQIYATSPPNNASCDVTFATGNVNAVPPTSFTVSSPGITIGNSAATYVFKQTTWMDVLPTPTLFDWIWFSLRIRNTSGGGAQLRQAAVDLRWVNK